VKKTSFSILGLPVSFLGDVRVSCFGEKRPDHQEEEQPDQKILKSVKAPPGSWLFMMAGVHVCGLGVGYQSGVRHNGLSDSSGGLVSSIASILPHFVRSLICCSTASETNGLPNHTGHPP
jgi:hypothetical protein